MNGEQARVWKEVVTTYVRVLPQHLLGNTEEYPEKS
jgi:hypothetical protein